MKYVKLGLDLFVKRLFINLLLTLQLVIALVAVNFSIARTESIYLNFNIINKIPNSKTISVIPSIETSHVKGDNYLDLTNIKGNYDLGESHIFFSSTENISGIKSYIYSKSLIDNINVPLKEGSWKSPIIVESAANIYPVVISMAYSDLKINDRFVLKVDNGIEFQAYIAGILNSNQRYLSLSKGGNVATSEFYFKRVLDSKNSKPMLFFNDEFFPKDTINFASNETSKFIFFDKNVDDEIYKENIKIISKQAYVFTLDDVLDNSREEINEITRYYIPFCIFIFAISLIGIISFTALSILQNTYYFSVLYLCGSRWKNCKYICLGYIGIICFVSSIFALLVYNVSKYSGSVETMDLYFTSMNLLISLIVISIVIITSMVIPYILMKRTSVAELIRKYEK